MLYRLSTPTIGFVKADGCGVAVTIPAGAILAVDNPLQDSSSGPPIDADWSGTTVRMFPIDILRRAEEVEPPSLHINAE